MLSWRPARRASSLAATAALAFGMLLPIPAHAAGSEVGGAEPGKAATPTPLPVDVEKTKVPAVAPDTDAKPGQVVAELPPTSTSKFRMIGVTWSEQGLSYGVKVEVRTRTAGTWSSWTGLEVDDGNDGGVPGTEPLWVGKADGVAARVTSTLGAPQDVRISTIDPGTGTTATASPATYSGPVDGVARVTAAATVSDGTPSYTSRPAIIRRSTWGANAGTPCDSPTVGESTRGVVVHHTAGSNSYAKEDSAAIVRGIQAYHMKSRGWCDIGYNFLVDKYGQIFEGRRGGIDRQVRAAHSGNATVNTYTMGVSMMGNLDLVQPSAAMKSSIVKLIGWRMGTTYLRAKGTYAIGGLTLNMIAGHRNVVSTGCPGKYGYAWLTASGGLRDRVATYISGYSSAAKRLAASMGSSATGPVHIGEAGVDGGRRTIFTKGSIYALGSVGAHWVSGTTLREYARVGGPAGRLGFPSTSLASTANPDVRMQRFQTGSIYRVAYSSTVKAFALWGAIDSTYRSLGASTGKLGEPRSSITSTSSTVSKATFENGYISYSSTTKKASAYVDGKLVETTATELSPDNLTIPTSGTFRLRGHGFGHGIGMSQYGAQGAALAGKTYYDILRSYYTGVGFAAKTAKIRVLITADTTASVIVKAQSGLVFRNVTAGTTTSLPTTSGGGAIQEWRIIQKSGALTQSTLQYKMADWHTYQSKVWTGAGQFEASSPLSLVMPDTSTRKYRGALRSSVPSSGSTDRNTVNVLGLDDYVRGVVAAEMPSSWHQQALRAQTVAARTYGAQAITSSRYYDICDTTSCQVYRGVAVETAATDNAVTGTAGKILTYNGVPAFTQFSSSSGGYTATGSKPYLVAKSDPYDAWSGNPNHDWSVYVSASTLAKKYPTLGTLTSLSITSRNGKGDWGGRVNTVVLKGTKGSVTISGNDMRSVLGLKSSWFRVH